MHPHYRYQIGVAGLVELIQKRSILIVVGVDILLGQLHVGLDKIGEHLDIQIHALFGQFGFDELENLGVRHRAGTHHQFFTGVNAERSKNSRKGNKLFHGKTPKK